MADFVRKSSQTNLKVNQESMPGIKKRERQSESHEKTNSSHNLKEIKIFCQV